jgi:SAM-dependent methyltransferase
MSTVAQLFGVRADAYASYRPHYPEALFHWLAQHSPDTHRALDVACGNGQASLPLSRHFRQVLASDTSLKQLQAATRHSHLHFYAAQATQQPLPAACLDLIVVAQALHWFATPAFFAEATRLLKPQGLFCAWCYSLMSITPELDELIGEFYWHTLQGYWPEGRSSVDNGYRDIQLPWQKVEPPAMALQAIWSLPHLIGYLRTWSALQHLEAEQGHEPWLRLTSLLQRAWGNPEQLRSVNWPLHFITGTCT